MNLDLMKISIVTLLTSTILMGGTVKEGELKNNDFFNTNAETVQVLAAEEYKNFDYTQEEDNVLEVEELEQMFQQEEQERKEKEEELLREKEKEMDNTISDEEFGKLNSKKIGEFKLTAYCSCEECCDSWGVDRPLDENGDEIVYTASGAIARAYRTIAVDTDVIPYGTRVIIDINGEKRLYVAEDCGGAIVNNRIDVYFDTHEEACIFGVKNGTVYILEN